MSLLFVLFSLLMMMQTMVMMIIVMVAHTFLLNSFFSPCLSSPGTPATGPQYSTPGILVFLSVDTHTQAFAARALVVDAWGE